MQQGTCMMNDPGTLYLVATPIGNLEDITLRALRILKEVDVIACEDTRQTIKLLNHYDIKNKLIAYHKFNEKKEAEKLVERLESGEDIALVSDAGLPIISDPGSILVQECNKRNIPVTVVPGANAGLTALMLSGLDARRFTFFGFPEKSKKGEKEFIKDIMNWPDTAIMYESPHHLLKTLKGICEIDPDRILSVSRELTKRYEETITDTAQNLLKLFEERPPRGEFVIIIDKNDSPVQADQSLNELSLKELVEKYIEDGLREKDAIKKAAAERGLKKRDVYEEIKIKKDY